MSGRLYSCICIRMYVRVYAYMLYSVHKTVYRVFEKL